MPQSDEGFQTPKEKARKAGFLRRKTAHSQSASEAAQAAAEHIAAYLMKGSGKILSAYMPIRTEIDPRPAMARAEAMGLKLCLPVVEGPERPLTFHAYSMGDPLSQGAFGAQIPERYAPLEPDILLVPLVAFTRAGFRLGYGGGFYDRSLARLRTRKTVEAIGFAFAAQEVAELPLEHTDQRLDQIVTEHGLVM